MPIIAIMQQLYLAINLKYEIKTTRRWFWL